MTLSSNKISIAFERRCNLWAKYQQESGVEDSVGLLEAGRFSGEYETSKAFLSITTPAGKKMVFSIHAAEGEKTFDQALNEASRNLRPYETPRLKIISGPRTTFIPVLKK